MEILLTRENSSMASSWYEMLVIKRNSKDSWTLTTCQHEILCSVDDLPDKLRIYDANDELVLPAEINGKKVIGLSDGEYLIGEDIVEGEPSIEFTKDNKSLVEEFLKNENWDLEPDFKKAFQRINEI